MKSGNEKRECPNGHIYFKSSTCPVCPVCEEEISANSDFLSGLGGPARRALENAGIKTVKELCRFSQKELLSLHGFGKASLPIVYSQLEKSGLKRD